MTERGTKALIGVFVLGAIALLTIFIILLGSGVMGNKNPTYALFFKTSLKGLIQGSPVYFKGIRVGKVKSILIIPAAEANSFLTPVIIEIEQGKTNLFWDDKENVFFEDNKLVNEMISKGLRARLGISSVLTGQLCVELDVFSNAESVDIASLKPFRDSPQIPTQLSSLDTALTTLENIPVQKVLMDIVRGLKNLGDQIDRTDLSGLVSSIIKTSNAAHDQIEQFTSLRQSLEKTLSSVNALANAVQQDFHGTAIQTEAAMSSAENLLRSSKNLIVKVENGIKEAEKTLSEIGKSSRTARLLLSEDSTAVQEYYQTMTALRKAAQSLSDLAVLLNVKPNSLIFGRQ